MGKVKPEDSIRKIVRNAILDAGRHIGAIANGTDPDALVPWSDHSTRVHVNLALTGHQQQNERVKQQVSAPIAFGVVFMPQKAESITDWEERARLAGAIDVKALPPKAEAK